MTTSSTGGKIIPTSTGLIHYANTERFVTESQGDQQCEKNLSYDFSQFPVVLPKNTTTGRIISFK